MVDLVFNCTGIPSGEYTNDLTLTLAPIEQPGVNAAPSAVWFTVSDVSGCAAGNPGVGEVRDPKFHDITYIWDFDDAANATPSNAADLLIPTAWKNINKAYGKRVAHVFNDPGTYTVTVTAYEPATRRMGTATTTVTVGDPKTVFPTTRTIIYNPNSINVTSYGYTGANVITTNWAAVLSARNALGATTAQILIAPGVTLSETQLCQDPSWGNIRIGGLDPNVKPVIGPYTTYGNFLIRDNGGNAIERVVFGLDFQGDWDSSTGTGVSIRPFSMFLTSADTYLTMEHRCNFDGWEAVTSHLSEANTYELYIMRSELTITNWQNFAMHGGNGGVCHVAVVACNAAQKDDATSVSIKDSTHSNSISFYNDHGPIRDFGSTTGYMAACDFFSRNGWATGGSYVVDGLAMAANQPCIRLNTTGFAGVKWNVERVGCEGWISLQEQGGAPPEVAGNYVFDKLLQTCAITGSLSSIEVRYSGSTFRNCLGVVPNVPSYSSNSVSRWFYVSNEGAAADNDEGVYVYNCSLIDLRDNTSANGVTMNFLVNDSGGNAMSDVVQANNIFEQPNRSPASTPDTPISLATASGYTTRHKGPRADFLFEEGTLGSAVAPGGYFTLSYANVKTTRNQGGSIGGNTDGGSATDQSYWTTNGGTKHHLIVNGTHYFAQKANNIEVTFEPTEIRVYNRTTATTWTSGWQWALKLDRSIAIPALNPTYNASGISIPLAIPTTGSAAIDDGDTGLTAYDDFLGTVRPATGNDRGAILAA